MNGAPRWHELSDDELLAQCDVQAHRASGPGGQHRNKASTAVRATHQPSGIVVVVDTERQFVLNRRLAIQLPNAGSIMFQLFVKTSVEQHEKSESC